MVFLRPLCLYPSAWKYNEGRGNKEETEGGNLTKQKKKKSMFGYRATQNHNKSPLKRVTRENLNYWGYED